MKPLLPLETEHLNAAVLAEMMIEGEGPGNAPRVKNGEGNSIAQRPIFISTPGQNFLGGLFFAWRRSHDRQAACKQPLTGNGASQLAQNERVRLRLDVVGNETGPLFRSDLPRHGYGLGVIRIVSIEQGENRT
jgi:hypothetical protein